MPAGDWGAGSYWRPDLMMLTYNDTGLVAGMTFNYAVHVPSGSTYPKTYVYAAPTPVPVTHALDVIAATAAAINNYEGIPLG